MPDQCPYKAIALLGLDSVRLQLVHGLVGRVYNAHINTYYYQHRKDNGQFFND